LLLHADLCGKKKGGTQREGFSLYCLGIYFVKKMQKESDVYHRCDFFEKFTRTNYVSRGDKRAHGPLSTLLSDRIPLYCKVDKLTNLTISF
jgi:hypothetical protein